MNVRRAKRVGQSSSLIWLDRLEALEGAWRAKVALDRIAWSSDQHDPRDVDAANLLDAVVQLLTREPCQMADPWEDE